MTTSWEIVRLYIEEEVRPDPSDETQTLMQKRRHAILELKSTEDATVGFVKGVGAIVDSIIVYEGEVQHTIPGIGGSKWYCTYNEYEPEPKAGWRTRRVRYESWECNWQNFTPPS